MSKHAKVRKTSSIQKKLLRFIIPFLFISFIALMIINFYVTELLLTNSAKRTLTKESTANAQTIAIDMLTSTSASSFSSAYKKIFNRPASLGNIYTGIEHLSVMGCGYSFLVDGKTGVILAHSDEGIRNTNIFEAPENSFLSQAAKLISLQGLEPVAAEIPADETDAAEGSEDAAAPEEKKFNITDPVDSTDSSFVTFEMVTHSSDIQMITDNGTLYYVVAEQILETPWVVISCLPDTYITDELMNLQLFMIILILIVLLITTVVMSLLISRTMSPVKKLTKVLTDITDGDFTVQINPAGNDEITVMSRALKDFVDIMREVITDIRSISDQLSRHSSSTKQISEGLRSTSEVQAESMGDMQATLNQIANAVQELALHAATLSEVVDTTSENGNQANKRMQQTVSVASQGKKDMELVEKTMSSIVVSMKQLETSVKDVGASTAEINSIVNLISEISEQTNLLSLNAAIEAARAGDAGRGFAVVAEEIRKLADVSSTSATQIGNIITKVNSQVGDMVTRTTQSVQYIQDNSEKITASCEIFDNIYQDVSSTSQVIQNIVTQMNQVDDVSTNMAALSQEQSASTEEILASTQLLAENSLKVSTDTKDVNESADAVADASFTLAEHMQRFKI